MNRVFVNWTVNNGNLPIKNYHLKHSAVAEDKGWQYASKKVEVNYTSFILEGLEPNKAYKLQLEAINEMGTGKDTPKSPVKTLKEGGVCFFTPNDFIKLLQINLRLFSNLNKLLKTGIIAILKYDCRLVRH